MRFVLCNHFLPFPYLCSLSFIHLFPFLILECSSFALRVALKAQQSDSATHVSILFHQLPSDFTGFVFVFFFFNLLGRSFLVGLVPLCLFLLYCQCFAYTVNYSWARLSRIYNEERMVSSINQAGNIGYPHAKG